jgi:hypothetical protein
VLALLFGAGMKTFDDLAIRIKIPLSFVLMLTIVMVLGLISINRLDAIKGDAEAIIRSLSPQIGRVRIGPGVRRPCLPACRNIGATRSIGLSANPA